MNPVHPSVLADLDRLRRMNNALLAHHETSLAEKFNDPMQDGGSNA